MDKKAAPVRAQKIGFLHHIRLVPFFGSVFGGILLLFALSSGLAGQHEEKPRGGSALDSALAGWI